MIPLFHADLFIEKNVGTPEQQKELKDFLISISQDDKVKNDPLSNEGCFRFNFNVLNNSIDWLNESQLKLTEKVMSHYTPLDKNYSEQLHKTKFTMYYNSWVNINEKGSKNMIHAHKDHMFASVYYLQGTDTGKIWFYNESNLLGQCSVTSPFVRRFGYEPEDGDLILWPAWVPHEVDVNTSNRQRINITSNIDMK